MKKPISAEQLKRKVLRKIDAMIKIYIDSGLIYTEGALKDLHDWLRAQPTGRGKG